MIEIGDVLPNLSLSVTDDTGVAADGGAVSLSITLPDQTTLSSPADVTILHPSVGSYYATYVALQPGLYTVTWTVTGANAGVFTDTPYVEQYGSMVSLADVKTALGIRRSSDDELLRSISLMASDLCESPEGTNRRWRRRVVTGEKHTARSSFQLFNAPVISVTSVTVDGVQATANDYDIDTVTGIVYDVNGFFASGYRRMGISVSYVAGSPTIPAPVRNGVMEMIRHLYAAHQGGSDLPASREPDYTTSLAYLIPNRVAFAWAAYRMPG